MKSSSLWPPKPGAALWALCSPSVIRAGAQPLLQPWPDSPQPPISWFLCRNLGGISLSVNPHCNFVPKQRGLNAPVAFSSQALTAKVGFYLLWLFPPRALYCLSESLFSLLFSFPKIQWETWREMLGYKEVLAKFCLLLLKNLLWVISLGVILSRSSPRWEPSPALSCSVLVVLANSFNSPSKILPWKHPLWNCPCRAPG